MAKCVSTRRIKGNRAYTYEEAAEALCVTSQTIRAWRKAGLDVMAEQTPHLILGYALKSFIAERTVKGRTRLRIDQVYCLGCKAARHPYGMMADYVPKDGETGHLKTLCDHCGSPCVRFIKASDLPEFAEKLDIATSAASNA